MTLEQVIEMLKVEYERAQKLKYVQKPLAYALSAIREAENAILGLQVAEKE